MEGTVGSRWRIAFVIAFVFHGIVLTGIGWMAGKAIRPNASPEALIEIELGTEIEKPFDTMEQTIHAGLSQASMPPQVIPARTKPGERVGEESTNAEINAIEGRRATGVPASDYVLANDNDGVPVTTSPGERQSVEAIIPPRIQASRDPDYPESARRAGVEGTVVLKVEILASGLPGKVRVISGGSDLLNAAAMDAVQHWRFIPAKVQATGQNIACQITFPVVFKLKS